MTKHFITLLILFFSITLTQSQDLKEIESEFLLYNHTLNQYIPLTKYNNQDLNVTIRINKNHINKYLNVYTQKKFYIYSNNKLILSSLPNQSNKIDQRYFQNNQPETYLTINSSTSIENITISDNKKPNFKSTLNSNSFSDFLTIKKNNKIFQTKYLVGFISLILLLVILKTVNSDFLNRFLKIAIDSIPKEREAIKKKVLSSENIVSYLVGISLLTVLYFVFGSKLIFLFHENSQNYSVIVASVFVFILVFLIVKVFLHISLNKLYNIKNFSRYLIYNLIVILILGLVLFTPFYFLLLSPYELFKFDLNLSFISCMIFIFILWLGKEIIDYTRFFGFYKMYLITYICVSDVFPFLILLKISKEFLS
ncbi:MAG: DUF4271 domain-containing protein [Bacteroidota bacterium]|nr:DUF4271 domain-containing protein [Bacteroidota bacterium]